MLRAVPWLSTTIAGLTQTRHSVAHITNPPLRCGARRAANVPRDRAWAFEPDGGSEDVLLSSATLWNVNLLVEALRVEDDDNPVPVAAVRERFQRWVAAAGSLNRLSTRPKSSITC